jgi:hypothetical protein
MAQTAILKAVRKPTPKYKPNIIKSFIEIPEEREARWPGATPAKIVIVLPNGLDLEWKGTLVLISWLGHLDSRIVFYSRVQVAMIMKPVWIWRMKEKKTFSSPIEWRLWGLLKMT